MMGVANANKQLICEQYKTYLDIIYHLGNKVMLTKQLWQYAHELGLANNLAEFYSQITKLEHSEIIRKEPFSAYGKKTQLQMLTLRKYGIRFVEGKENSYCVASVPKAASNERILVSIFKNCYIQSKILPRIHNESKKVTFDKIIDMLRRDCSTILLNKNEGVSYLSQLISNNRLQPYLLIPEINHVLAKMRIVEQKRLEGLKKGSCATVGKGKGKLFSSSDVNIDLIFPKTIG